MRGSLEERKRAMPVWQSEGGRMRDPDKIVICMKCGDTDEASALSARTGLPLREEPGEELTRCFETGQDLLRPTPVERAAIQTVALELVNEYYGNNYCY